jgi:hypothetical protein
MMCPCATACILMGKSVGSIHSTAESAMSPTSQASQRISGHDSLLEGIQKCADMQLALVHAHTMWTSTQDITPPSATRPKDEIVASDRLTASTTRSPSCSATAAPLQETQFADKHSEHSPASTHNARIHSFEGAGNHVALSYKSSSIDIDQMQDVPSSLQDAEGAVSPSHGAVKFFVLCSPHEEQLLAAELPKKAPPSGMR